MSIEVRLSLITTVILVISSVVLSFPDGGPVDVCHKPKPNQPYHGQTKPQPANRNPYKIIPSSNNYEPGSQISVKIQGTNGVPFRGFFIQARDTKTNKWIGSFARTPNTVSYSECSSVTHSDPQNKQQANLVWNAPADSKGSVYFTGSILKDFATYWVDVKSDQAKN